MARPSAAIRWPWPVGNAVLDVVLAPGFLERVARLGLVLRQRLAELRDRHPQVIEEIRGEGLMLGREAAGAQQRFRRRRARRRNC